MNSALSGRRLATDSGAQRIHRQFAGVPRFDIYGLGVVGPLQSHQ